MMWVKAICWSVFLRDIAHRFIQSGKNQFAAICVLDRLLTEYFLTKILILITRLEMRRVKCEDLNCVGMLKHITDDFRDSITQPTVPRSYKLPFLCISEH